MPCFRLPARQRGAAMLEFTAAALPVLLAGAAALEAARWYAVRQALSLALHEAARAAAVAHAEPRTLHQAFERALRPLFVPPGPHAGAPARMQAEAARLLARTGLQPWQIEVLGPPASAYVDFGRAWPGAAGAPAISNDYLAEQHGQAIARGWPQGRGPASGLTIHEANVLHLRLTYAHAPLLPVTAALLRALAPETGRAYADRIWRAGLLPIVAEARMTMQSHPVRWKHGTQRVGTAAADAGAPAAAGGDVPPAGWASDAISVLQPRPPGGASPRPGAGQPPPATQPAPGPDAGDAGGQPPGSAMDGDELCGIALCCG